jgi:hypothetical protein
MLVVNLIVDYFPLLVLITHNVLMEKCYFRFPINNNSLVKTASIIEHDTNHEIKYDSTNQYFLH